MKKIIAAILSAWVGLFGYTIVDTAIEARMTTAESEISELKGEVSMLRGEISEYHAMNPAPTKIGRAHV